MNITLGVRQVLSVKANELMSSRKVGKFNQTTIEPSCIQPFENPSLTFPTVFLLFTPNTFRLFCGCRRVAKEAFERINCLKFFSLLNFFVTSYRASWSKLLCSYSNSVASQLQSYSEPTNKFVLFQIVSLQLRHCVFSIVVHWEIPFQLMEIPNAIPDIDFVRLICCASTMYRI
jgi:hypothetical protein